MTRLNDNIVGIDAAIFMHPTTWKASGHVDNFSDPMIDNRDSKKRYRVDHLLEAHADKPGARRQGKKNLLYLNQWMTYSQRRLHRIKAIKRETTRLPVR